MKKKRNTNAQTEHSKKLRATTTATLFERYPVALNYRGDTLEVWYYERTRDYGSRQEINQESAHTYHVYDVFAKVGEVCKNIVRKLLTTAGTSHTSDITESRDITVYKLNGEEIYRADHTSTRSVITDTPEFLYQQQGGAEGEPYPIHENPARSTQQRDVVTKTGGSALEIDFIDIRNRVVLVRAARSYTSDETHLSSESYDSTSTGTVGTHAGEVFSSAEWRGDYIFRVNGRTIDIPPSINQVFYPGELPVVPIAARGVFVGGGPFWFDPSIPQNVEESTTHLGIKQPVPYEIGLGYCEFSWVKDERLRCHPNPYAYSLKCWDGVRETPYIANQSGFGPLLPLLPEIGADKLPTGQTLDAPGVTLFPVGLF